MNAFTEAANIQSKLFTEAAGSCTSTTIPKVKMQTIFANPDENNEMNEMESETAHYEVPETESETTDEDGVQRVIETGCVPKIISYLARGNSENQREAACDISELISCSNKDQVTYFLAQGVIPPLCNLLNCDSEYRLLRSVLNILIDMLKVPGQDQYTLDDIAFAISDCGGLDKIKSLRNHLGVHKLADQIIEHFSDEQIDGNASQNRRNQNFEELLSLQINWM